MSMLAGPRRKQKVINLRAKNNAWSNDNNKFGQRMLEKMGWCSGKGLGAKENGIVEHVVAKYKNDDRGLGFEDKNDQWTKHEDDFNALLANLSNADSNEEKLHSGVSLEVKSKKSKARIHYHKFTRGKDIARYSEKDLANIFGKKSLKNEEKVEETLIEDELTTEKVFTEKGSMEDYFKNKMEAFNLKNKLPLPNYNESQDEEADYVFKGFAAPANDAEQENVHQGFGFQPFSFYGSSENNDQATEPVPDQDSTEIVKKNKKKKKSKKEIVSENDCTVSPVVDTEGTEDFSNELESEQLSVEKVKKSKKKRISEEELANETEQDVPKKKKSKKNNSAIPEEVQEHNTDQDIHVPKKKKKRKNKEM